MTAWTSPLRNCHGSNSTLTTSGLSSCRASKACFLSRTAPPTKSQTKNFRTPAAAAKDLPSLAPVRQPARQKDADKDYSISCDAWGKPFPLCTSGSWGLHFWESDPATSREYVPYLPGTCVPYPLRGSTRDVWQSTCRKLPVSALI